MSISQTSRFLGGLPKDEPTPKYYFMYDDHFTHASFLKHIVATKKITIGFLTDWTWHINSKHKPNIRFTFNEHKIEPFGPVVAPATQFPPFPPPIDGTFGFIIELNPELELILARLYDDTRVAMVQNISFYVNNFRGTGQTNYMAKALVYWDPIHTADGLRMNLLADVHQREQWKKGLMALMSIGVPIYWLNAIQRRLVGERVDPEPLFSIFPRVPKPLMPIPLQLVYHNGELQEKLPTPQNPRQRDPQHPVSGSRPPSPIIQHQPVIRGSVAPPPRPQPVFQDQAVQDAMGQPQGLGTPIIQLYKALKSQIGPPAGPGTPKPNTPQVQQKRVIQGAMAPPPKPTTVTPIIQRNTAIQSQTGPSRDPTPVKPIVQQNSTVHMKRKADSSGDRLTEELKRMKGAGRVGEEGECP